MIKIEIPEKVKYIFELFNKYNYEIYLVGGCIRDSIMNKKPHDWDFTTNALPEQMINICKSENIQYVPTGIKHGTISFFLDKEGFEITTYRIDGDYSNGRHPDSVVFTGNLKDDLLRRDFTINALAYNEKEGLIDYFNGLEDLKNKIIRCVGKAEDRFNEDNLRRLRAVRFACQLNFKIENSTLHALMVNSQRLMLLSIERIREEICKILLSDNVKYGMIELWKLDMLKYILPELDACYDFQQFNPHHNKDVFFHTLSVVENTPKELELRLAALLHDIAKPRCFTIDNEKIGHFYQHSVLSSDMSKEILTRLRFDNKTINTVCSLVYNHMTPTNLSEKSIKKLIQRIGTEEIYKLMNLMIADRLGMAKEHSTFTDILTLQEKITKILNEKQPLSVKDLDINGHDLIQLGYKGKEIGNKLNELLEIILEKPELNHKDKLIALIK